MSVEAVERAFLKIGSRVEVTGQDSIGFRNRPFSLDILRDKDGEYFKIRARYDVSLQVLQVAAKDRHLLLHVAEGKNKSKFLCGQDERHWFVAAIPENEPVRTVEEAKDALRPKELVKDGNWIRQGEWFFIPRPDFHLPKNTPTTHDEPLMRRTSDGRGGKPHIATEAAQFGGDAVYVNRRIAPQGFNEAQYKAWCLENPKKIASTNFQGMVRNAAVFVRGEIRHPDHKTLKLGNVWHEVKMNRESESRAMASMVFLD